MQIKSMTATFGKLDGATLQLQPGLNIIHAPNESGKSTWCAFIRTMLYGLVTRDRGTLADKNRYAPWSGASMAGLLELETTDGELSVRRTTLRPHSPMGEFSCTYTGTAESVPGMTGADLGEALLGVGRDVFVRSAFIGQSGLALDKDAELERRIAALVTTGQEDVSFSETYERLKKQLNRRRHNKTGQIPQLEQEVADLRRGLEQLQALHEQADSARQQLQHCERQAQEIRQRLEQWEALEKQEALQAYLRAQTAAQTAADYAQTLALAHPTLPEAAELGRINGMADALDRTLEDAQQAGEKAIACQNKAKEAESRWQAHPLYPATPSQLQERADAIVPAVKRFSLLLLLPALTLGGGIGYGLWYFLQQWEIPAAAGAAAAAAVLLIYNSMRRHRNRRAADEANAELARFDTQCDQYLALLHRHEEAQAEAQQTAAAARTLHANCRQGLLQLLGSVQPFAPEVTNLTNVRRALEQATLCRHKLDRAAQEAKNTHLHCQLLRQHLPPSPLPNPNAVLPRPATAQPQLAEALPRTLAGVQSARSQLDSLRGQLQAMGDRDQLESRLARKETELQQLQGEYESIAAAMEALTRADQTLQNRFSPELGRRAADIFAALTDGQYHQVLFDRSFALSAAPAGDISPRDIRLLSQGAADQLYLAVRLAICQTVLPSHKPAPLILDDALANFDHRRMAAALEYLLGESQQRQILLFTCHTRESEYLRGRSGVHHIAL